MIKNKKQFNPLRKKVGGFIAPIEWKRNSVKVGYSVMYVALFLITVVCLFPTIWILLSGMKDVSNFYSSGLLPKKLNFNKYVIAWNKINFLQYYKNTLTLAGGSMVSAVVFNGLLGFALSRVRPAGSRVISKIMLWTILLPPTMSIVTLYKNIVSVPLLGINLTNQYLPFWLLSGASAYNVLLFKSFFDGIPPELIEAARIDGYSDLKIFFKIIIPLSMPVFMVVIIFSLNGTWSDFLLPYMVISDVNKQPIMVKLFTMRGNAGLTIDMQYISITLSIIPPVILFLIFQNKIMGGFALSGIKG